MATRSKAEAGASSAKRKRSEDTPATEPQQRKKARLTSDLSMTSSKDIKLLKAVQSKYDVQVHSVISSSKIQKKVTSVIQHLTSSVPTPSSTKGAVSILRAKAADAGKLITISEIAKREISKQKGVDDGRWFQYIGLGEEIKETAKEKDKSKGEGKTIVEDTMLGGEVQMEDEPQDDADDKTDDDDVDDFEIMQTPHERAIEGRPMLRSIPIMSLFLSRISIVELKKRYGEQTDDSQSNNGK